MSSDTRFGLASSMPFETPAISLVGAYTAQANVCAKCTSMYQDQEKEASKASVIMCYLLACNLVRVVLWSLRDAEGSML